MKIVCVRLKVSGRVQGVFFRASMSDVAMGKGVVGWVRNNPDGSVEALLQGREESVKAVQEWARNGPPGARVDSVEVKAAKPDPSLRDFKVVR